jgi:hypothetical protein
MVRYYRVLTTLYTQKMENVHIFDLTDLLGLVSGHKEFAFAERGELQTAAHPRTAHARCQPTYKASKMADTNQSII